jgi:hypothetical protein
MLTLIHSDGRAWPVSDAFAELAGLPDPVLRELLNLARAQAALVAVRPGEVAHAFPCRHRREAERRGEVPPVCRWVADPAGGHACKQCGTWAKPDGERSRVLGGLAAAPRATAGRTFTIVSDKYGHAELRADEAEPLATFTMPDLVP